MRSPLLSALLALALVALGGMPGGLPCGPEPSPKAAAAHPCGGEADAAGRAGHPDPGPPASPEAPGCCAVCAATFSLRLKSEAPVLPVPPASAARPVPEGGRDLPTPPHEPPTPPPRLG